jgi:hypothetical protein
MEIAMNRKLKIKMGTVFSASAASLVLQLLPAAAIAQEEAKGVFEEVLVTARKRSESYYCTIARATSNQKYD